MHLQDDQLHIFVAAMIAAGAAANPNPEAQITTRAAAARADDLIRAVRQYRMESKTRRV